MHSLDYTSLLSCALAAGMAVVGTTDGILYAHTARDPLQIGQHHAHSSTVSAMVSKQSNYRIC